jgi:hypothetical protein
MKGTTIAIAGGSLAALLGGLYFITKASVPSVCSLYNITLKGTLQGDTGVTYPYTVSVVKSKAPVPNIHVAITDSVSKKVYTGTTDSNGNATINIAFAKGVSHALTATALVSGKTTCPSNSLSVAIHVPCKDGYIYNNGSCVQVKFAISTPDLSFHSIPAKFVVSALLLTTGNTPISSYGITLTVGKLSYSATTNAGGQASFNVDITAYGIYTITGEA